MPTAIFVLTDGEVRLLMFIDVYLTDDLSLCKSHDVKGTCDIVAFAVANAPTTAGIRVFTLGIGTKVSSAMCEGIARAGNGVCLMANEAESILSKCAKLVRAGRNFVLRDVTIDWGVPPDALVSAQDGQASGVRFAGAGPHTVLRQSPSFIETIYPGHRFIVFALIRQDKFIIPQHVTLRAKRDGTAGDVEIQIPVEQVKFIDEEPQIPLIHTLAARRLIMELQDSLTMTEDEKKASIVPLGEQYQLASKYTSFVAVDGHHTHPVPASRRSITSFQRRKRSAQNIQIVRNVPPNVQAAAFGIGEFVMSALEWTSLFVTAALDVITEPYKMLLFGRDVSRRDTGLPGGYRPPTPDSIDSARQDLNPPEPDDENESGSETSNTFSTISSLDSYSDTEWSDSTSTLRRRRRQSQQIRTRSPSPQFRGNASGAMRSSSMSPQKYKTLPTPPEVFASINNLVELQSFDGSFRLDDKLGAIVGQAAADDSKRPAQADAQLWATALAVAYMQKHLTDPDLLESLLEKAYEFVVSSGADVDFRRLVAQAKSLVN